MLKPSQLRDFITQANPALRRDPDKMQVFLDTGTIVAAGGKSLSYEYQYTLNIIVQDYRGHADAIILPMLAWLRTNQPELFENADKRARAIRFEVEFLNQETVDLSIEVDLTERVLVLPDEAQGGRLTATHIGEPQHPEFLSEPYTLEVYDKKRNELLAAFEFPSWTPVL